MRRQDKIILARLNRQIANGDGREMIAFELGPVFSAIDGHPQTKLGSEKKQIRCLQIFLNHMRVTANAFGILRIDERRPRFPVIRRAKNVRRHVAECMSIKRGVGRACIEVAGLHPAHPGIFREAGNIADDVVPGFSGVAGDLKIAIIGPNPDQIFVFGRFADRINRGVHFRRRIVHRHATGLFLLLFLRIVCGQIGRNALPVLAVIARAK